MLLVALLVTAQLTAVVSGLLGARHAEGMSPTVSLVSLTQTDREQSIHALADAHAMADREAAAVVLASLIWDSDPDVAQAAADAIIADVSSTWPADHRSTFLRTIGPEALLAARDHDLPPSVMLAQAALESGWGRSTLATRYNNFFGMKAGAADPGKVGAVLLETVEGVGTPATARFRRYATTNESVRDHARLIAGDPRYAAARDASGNWRRYAAALAPVYATDPAYVQRLVSLVERYKLNHFDELLTAG